MSSASIRLRFKHLGTKLLLVSANSTSTSVALRVFRLLIFTFEGLFLLISSPSAKYLSSAVPNIFSAAETQKKIERRKKLDNNVSRWRLRGFSLLFLRSSIVLVYDVRS